MPQFSLDLHFTIEREDDIFVATCDDLDIASHGDTVEDAFSRCKDAINLYLAVLAEDGELDAVLKSRGLVPQATQNLDTHSEHFSTISRVLVSAGS
jgi:predicted RNase H-like HicB family nuclease